MSSVMYLNHTRHVVSVQQITHTLHTSAYAYGRRGVEEAGQQMGGI